MTPPLRARFDRYLLQGSKLFISYMFHTDQTECLSTPFFCPLSFLCSFFLCGPHGRVRASCAFVCLSVLCWSASVVSVCSWVCVGGCCCMLACFMSLVCVRRRQVRRCSLPRPPPLLFFCFLLTACFSRTRDGSGWVGADYCRRCG